MRHRTRPPLTAKEAVVLSGMAVAAIAIVAALVGAYIRLSSLAPGGGEFFAIWNASRSILGGADPYTHDAAGIVQALAYGGPAPAGANPYWLELPLFLLPPFMPFGLVTSPAVARGVWSFLGQAALLAAVFLTARLMDWRPSGPVIVALGFLSLGSFYALAALADGSPAMFLPLSYVSALLAMRAGRDELAGAIAALSLVLWEVGFVFLLLVAWRVVYERRWGIVAGFAMSLLILSALSFLIRSDWMLPFLTAAVAMIRSPHGITTSTFFQYALPDLGLVMARGVTLLVLGLLVLEWAASRHSDFRRFSWLCFLALAATPLLGLRTELSHVVVLTPCLVLVTAATSARAASARLMGALIIGLAVLVPWAIFLRWYSIGDRLAQGLLLLYWPSLIVVCMYWTRWWFLRPVRTWLDEVRLAGK